MTTQTDRNELHNVLVQQARGSIFDYSGQDVLWREYHDTLCRYCRIGLYEAEVTRTGLLVTCPNCGHTLEVDAPGPNPAAVRY